MKNYFRPTWVLAATFTKRFFRDKVAIFFTFLFPLIFLFVFGTINRGTGEVSFDIALLNHSDTAFARQFTDELKKNSAIKINEKITNHDDAVERMGRGEIDSILELPADFGKPNEQGVPNGRAVVYYEEASPQAGQTFASVMTSIFDGVNAQLVPQQEPFAVEQRATKTTTLKTFDYVFAGLLGFSMLSLGLFGMANGLPADKKAGYLRRLRATPLRPSQLIMATALNYLLIGIITIALMLALGIWFFDFQMRGDYLNLTFFVIIGIILMMGFGLAIGGWAKNEIQAAPLTNIVALPMMFLSGSFFPRFIMPEWLQSVSAYLPLTPINDGMRLIMTEGKTLVDLGPQLGLMAIWIAVIYLIAFRVFKWE